MHTITITTPENIDIEYRLAGIGSRLAAATVDMTIQFCIMIVISILVYISIFDQNNIIFTLGLNSWLAGIFLLAYLLVFLGYPIIIEILMDGQSIGKKLFKLRVIRENGRPSGIVQAVIRNLFKYLLEFMGIGVVCILVSKKCKRLGDMVANTIVISENPEQIKTSGLTPLSQVSYVENSAFALTAEEVYWLHEYFIRKDTFLSNGEFIVADILDYFSQKFGVPNHSLNEALLLKILEMNTLQQNEQKKEDFFGD